MTYQNLTVQDMFQQAADAKNYELLKWLIEKYKEDDGIKNLQIPNLLNTFIVHGDLESIKFILSAYDNDFVALKSFDFHNVFLLKYKNAIIITYLYKIYFREVLIDVQNYYCLRSRQNYSIW